MKKVWKVKTDLTEEQNRKFATSLTEEEHALMTELNLQASVDLLEGDTITSFMVCDESSIGKIKSLLEKYKANFEIEEVSDFFEADGTAIEQITESHIYAKLGL